MTPQKGLLNAQYSANDELQEMNPEKNKQKAQLTGTENFLLCQALDMISF